MQCIKALDHIGNNVSVRRERLLLVNAMKTTKALQIVRPDIGPANSDTELIFVRFSINQMKFL